MKRHYPPQKQFDLLKQGCPSAFADIHAQHSRSIFWIGRDLIKDSFVVETLVQDTFMKLWVHRDRIETPKHIFFFLRFVMIRECYSFYTRPKNKFNREISFLEHFGNYQDYMVGYDPVNESENLKDQKSEQESFDRIKGALPFLNAGRRHLIELCLRYGFRYKAIAEAMGMSITETANEVKRAIQEIKTIVHQGNTLTSEQKHPRSTVKTMETMTEKQEEILKLRFHKQYSFVLIAEALDLSQKEVHKEFVAAYRLWQEKQNLQLESA